MIVKFKNLNTMDERISKSINENLLEVVKNKTFLNDKFSKLLSDKFKEMHKVKYATPCTSGGSATLVAGKVLGLKDGDEIICPAYAPLKSISPLTVLGVKPAFVDVNPYSFVLDETRIESAITKDTKAILAVHLFGNPCRMDIIMKIAEKHDLKVIEDCSHALFSKYKGKPVGKYGDIGIFSFDPDASLGAYGNAGMIVTEDTKTHFEIEKTVYYGELEVDEIQAGSLIDKLDNLTTSMTKRKNIARIYSQHFVSNINVQQQLPTPPCYHSYYNFVILVKNKEFIVQHMTKNKIEIDSLYSQPLPLHEEFVDLNYEFGKYPVAEKFVKELIALPMYSNIPLDHVNKVAEKLNEVTL